MCGACLSLGRPPQRSRRQLLTGEVEYRVTLVDSVPVVHVESPSPATAPRLSRATMTIVGCCVNHDAAASGFGGGLERYPPPSAEQRAQPHHRVLQAKEPVGFRQGRVVLDPERCARREGSSKPPAYKLKGAVLLFAHAIVLLACPERAL